MNIFELKKLEAALDKACEILADEDNEIYEIDPEHDGSDGCTVVLNPVHKTKEEWKEHLLSESK